MLQCCCNFTTISVCQQLSKYNSVWLSYSKNKGVQFFCPTVYSYRLIESLHQVAGTQSLNRIDPVHPDRVVEEKSSRTHMYVNVNHKSRRAQSWRISTALYVLSGSVQNKFIFNNNCLKLLLLSGGSRRLSGIRVPDRRTSDREGSTTRKYWAGNVVQSGVDCLIVDATGSAETGVQQSTTYLGVSKWVDSS